MKHNHSQTNAVFRACMSLLDIGQQQVIDKMTSTDHGRILPNEDVKRTIEYLQKSIDELSGSVVEQFFALNKTARPVADLLRGNETGWTDGAWRLLLLQAEESSVGVLRPSDKLDFVKGLWSLQGIPEAS